MVRRVLKIIREEYATLLGQTGESVGKDSLHRMLTAAEAGIYKAKYALHGVLIMHSVNIDQDFISRIKLLEFILFTGTN